LFSNFANTQLKAGDLVEVGVPEGFFQLPTNANQHKSYMGIAAGSGITPILSMIQSVLADEPQSTFTLIYGNKTPEDTIFYSQLHELQAAHPERFYLQYIFSRTKLEQALFGRIDRSALNYTMNQHASKAIDHYFLCGPELMIHEISAELKAKNVAESAIKFELFSSTPAEKSESTSQGNTTISILVDGETTTFEMPQKQTVLEAALKKGIDAPYSCQGGICSSCLGRVTKGSAQMVKNTILSDSEVAEGLILTCQAHPTSSELFVDFDDV
jgi:ring-1,2-phenylacetyl-CoA epoxidase subunit PaaE